MPARGSYYDFITAFVDLKTGLVTPIWQRWLLDLFGLIGSSAVDLTALTAQVNAIEDVNRWALASQPSLGAGDAGYRAEVTDYGLRVRWTGSAWEFAPGNGNGFRRDFLFPPQEVGWALMDGSTVAYLVVGGATLTTANITLPNLVGSPAFSKSIAAYTGTIEAAIAPVVSLTGETATVGVSGGAGNMDIFGFNADAGATSVVSSGSTFAHKHTLGTLAATGNTAARPPSIGFLPFFKR